MREETTERLSSIRTGRAKLREATSEAVSAISSLDVRPDQEQTQQQTKRAGSTKLAEANRVGQEMERELRTLTEGVIDQLTEIGLEVTQSSEFRGASERTLALIGKILPSALDRAQVMRIRRLEHATVDQSVKTIQEFVQQTIQELGAVEHEYEIGVTEFQTTIDKVLAKHKQATPEYLEAKRQKEELEAAYATLELELKSGSIAPANRPQKEKEFEDLARKVQAARLRETDALVIVNEAQRAIPELQKNKEAFTRTIESIHGLRRNLLEKIENLIPVLSTAMSGVRGRAKLARVEAVDPAFNKTIDLVTEHNIAVSGAALQIAADRLSKAPIDPVRSKELLDKLLAHITDFVEEFAKIEEEGTRGVRATRQTPEA